MGSMDGTRTPVRSRSHHNEVATGETRGTIAPDATGTMTTGANPKKPVRPGETSESSTSLGHQDGPTEASSNLGQWGGPSTPQRIDTVDPAPAPLPSNAPDEPRSPCLMPFADLKARLRLVPTQPGVYLMRDPHGRILYVGKAGVLRNRVRSYFQKQDDLGIKVQHLVARIASFDWIVTATEQEALILENNLLKEHHPRYNIKLRDDKQYLYLKISMNQRYPRISTARRTSHDGSRYFGPYSDPTALRETVKHLQRLFQFRTCTLDMDRTYQRACLLFHIKRCSAPCVRAIDETAYRASVQDLIHFMEGRGRNALDSLRIAMEAAAGDLQFERAAALRDRIRAAEQVIEKQRITSVGRGDLDAIAYAADGDEVVVQVFTVRDDNVVGREEFVLSDTAGAEAGEIVAQFVQQYYERATFVPPLVLVQASPMGEKTLREWMATRRGGAVHFEVPQRGPKKDLLDLVDKNATLALKRMQVEWLADRRKTTEALRELAEGLNLSDSPRRIECYDISHVQGTSTVASMVVFEDGNPARHAYRRFKMKAGDQNDDFKSMYEVIERRFRRAQAASQVELRPSPASDPGNATEVEATSPIADETNPETASAGDHSPASRVGNGTGGLGAQSRPTSEVVDDTVSLPEDAGEAGLLALDDDGPGDQTDVDTSPSSDGKGWGVWPDLVIIDGGKGQLGAAVEALETLGVAVGTGGLPIVGLAKQYEELFRPGYSQAVLLPRTSQALYLGQRIRDEAHRFAVTYHQLVRSKRQIGSRLDRVDGVGPKRKKALMLRFGSLAGIKAATDAELLTVPGITTSVIAQLREQL